MHMSKITRPGVILNLGNSEQEATFTPTNIVVAHSNQTASLGEALHDVMNKIQPIIDSTMKDDAVAYHIIDKADLNPPLQINEIIVLACAIICQARGVPLTYNEVLDLTDEIRGRPLNIKSIYNSIDSLTERNLLIEGDQIRREHTGRPSRSFKVTEAGRNIFAISAIYSHQLVKARSQSAA